MYLNKIKKQYNINWDFIKWNYLSHNHFLIGPFKDGKIKDNVAISLILNSIDPS